MASKAALSGPSLPAPLAIARSILSLGIPAALAFSIAVRSWKLPLGSGTPLRAATIISRELLVKTLPFTASTLAFWRLILAHLLCPAIKGEVRLKPLKTADD